MKKKVGILIEDGLETGNLDVKMPTMPLTTKMSKGHSRLSSMIDSFTNTSSMFTDRYDVAADRLDWSVPLTESHKKMY